MRSSTSDLVRRPTARADSSSSAASTSSSSSTRGRVANARSSATRAAWPPDSCAALRPSSTSCKSAASSRRSRSPSAGGAEPAFTESVQGSSRLSRTVPPTSAGCCGTRHTRRRHCTGSNEEDGAPSKNSSPPSRASMRAHTRKSVDFPDPDGPTRSYTPPASSEKLAPDNNVVRTPARR